MDTTTPVVMPVRIDASLHDLLEISYVINASKSKQVSVGTSVGKPFEVYVRVGRVHDAVTLRVAEWDAIVSQKDALTTYFNTPGTAGSKTGSKISDDIYLQRSIFFDKKVISITWIHQTTESGVKFAALAAPSSHGLCLMLPCIQHAVTRMLEWLPHVEGIYRQKINTVARQLTGSGYTSQYVLGSPSHVSNEQVNAVFTYSDEEERELAHLRHFDAKRLLTELTAISRALILNDVAITLDTEERKRATLKRSRPVHDDM